MIKEFQGEYRWLSNFADCPIFYMGVWYSSVECAYQSAKSDMPEWKRYCMTHSAKDVKVQSKNILSRPDWESKKLGIMWGLLNQKYRTEPYKTLLLDTEDLYIQEGNRWKDRFWGIDLRTGNGENHLGKMTMVIRNIIRREQYAGN